MRNKKPTFMQICITELHPNNLFKFNVTDQFTRTVHNIKLTKFNEVYLHCYSTSIGSPYNPTLGIYKPSLTVYIQL